MFTRGCVAIKTDDGWKGVYNHWDSYPTALGKDLWDHLHEAKKGDSHTYHCLECGKCFKDNLLVAVHHHEQIVAYKCPYCRGKIGRDLNEFAEKLLQFVDWREYLNNGVCEYCGKRLGQPCSISGVLLCLYSTPEEVRGYWHSIPWAKDNPDEVKREIEQELVVLHNIEQTGYPDPKAKHHSHVTRDQAQMTHLDANPLFIEWVYIIDSKKRTVTILAHQSDKKTEGTVRNGKPILRDDGYYDYGHCAFKHVEVASFSLDSDEPDWKRIEQKRV